MKRRSPSLRPDASSCGNVMCASFNATPFSLVADDMESAIDTTYGRVVTECRGLCSTQSQVGCAAYCDRPPRRTPCVAPRRTCPSRGHYFEDQVHVRNPLTSTARTIRASEFLISLSHSIAAKCRGRQSTHAQHVGIEVIGAFRPPQRDRIRPALQAGRALLRRVERSPSRPPFRIEVIEVE